MMALSSNSTSFHERVQHQYELGVRQPATPYVRNWGAATRDAQFHATTCDNPRGTGKCGNPQLGQIPTSKYRAMGNLVGQNGYVAAHGPEAIMQRIQLRTPSWCIYVCIRGLTKFPTAGHRIQSSCSNASPSFAEV